MGEFAVAIVLLLSRMLKRWRECREAVIARTEKKRDLTEVKDEQEVARHGLVLVERHEQTQLWFWQFRAPRPVDIAASLKATNDAVA